MRPTNFDEAYKKPLGAGGNPGTQDLPFCRASDPGIPGVVFIVSCWEPTDEELAEIIRTKKVYLSVMANPSRPTQPPVGVCGFNYFTAFGENNFRRIDHLDEHLEKMASGATTKDDIDKVKAEINGKTGFQKLADELDKRAIERLENNAGDLLKDQAKKTELMPGVEEIVRKVVADGADPYNSLTVIEHGITKEEVDRVLEIMADEAKPVDPLING